MFDATTKINDILAQYPFLKEEVLKRIPEAKIIDNPIGKAMLKNATVNDIASKVGMTPEQLLNKLQSLIDEHKS